MSEPDTRDFLPKVVEETGHEELGRDRGGVVGGGRVGVDEDSEVGSPVCRILPSGEAPASSAREAAILAA